MTNEQLFAALDRVQHQQELDRIRVDELVKQFNAFVLEIRNNLAVLLDAKNTDAKESSNGN